MVVLGRVLYVKGRLSRGYVRSDFVLILGGVKGCFSSDFVWYRTEVQGLCWVGFCLVIG